MSNASRGGGANSEHVVRRVRGGMGPESCRAKMSALTSALILTVSLIFFQPQRRPAHHSVPASSNAVCAVVHHEVAAAVFVS